MIRLCRPTTKSWAAQWLEAPENAEVNVKKVSPPSLVMRAVRMARPPNRVVNTVKMVKLPSRGLVITNKANTPRHATAVRGRPPNEMVDAVRPRGNGIIGRSNGMDGAMGNPAQGKTILMRSRAKLGRPLQSSRIFKVFFLQPASHPP